MEPGNEAIVEPGNEVIVPHKYREWSVGMRL